MAERVESLRSSGSDEDRINAIKEMRYVKYPFAQKTLAWLEEIRTYPKQPRMPCLLIAGTTGNGKTTIAKRFQARHPENPNINGDAIEVPVVHMDAPPKPVEGRFYNRLLSALGALFKPNDRLNRKEGQALKLLDETGVKVLMIDEVQHFLAGSEKQARAMLNTIKSISNQLELPIVALGTEESLDVVAKDSQIKSRFDIAPVPRWRPDVEFRRMLASFEQLLPLKEKTGLGKKKNVKLVHEIYEMSNGTIGEVAKTLKKAGKLAISKGTERITVDLLSHVRLTTEPDTEKELLRIMREGKPPND